MLSAVDIDFRQDPAHIDERTVEASLPQSDPAAVAIALSAAKAGAVSSRHPGALVLGSDSLVVVEGSRFDKPTSRAEAAAHLHAFSGRVIELHSAAALVRDGVTLWEGGDVARLSVRALSEPFIAAYLAAEWPDVAACVGVFRIEARGPHLFERIEGDQFTVLGMPLLRVLAALRRHDAHASGFLQ